MDIQELEVKVRCLQCEAQQDKIHACDCEWASKQCKQRIGEAYLELIRVWDGKYLTSQ